MNRRLGNNQIRWRRQLGCAVVCVALTLLTGCQAMVQNNAKAKSAIARDRFSCGEPLPRQIP